MHRDEARRDRHFGPGADPPDVMRIVEADCRKPVLLRTLDGDGHAVVADDLAIASLTVEAHERPGIELKRGRLIQLKPAFLKRLHIARDHANAVAVVALEVGFDKVLRDELCLARVRAALRDDRLDGGDQLWRGYDDVGGHAGPLDRGICSSKSVARLALPAQAPTRSREGPIRTGLLGRIKPLQQSFRPRPFLGALVTLDDAQDGIACRFVAPLGHFERHGVPSLVVAAVERHDIEREVLPVVLALAPQPAGIDLVP